MVSAPKHCLSPRERWKRALGGQPAGAMPPSASYIDDEALRAVLRRSPSELKKACFPLLGGWARPSEANRESGPHGNS